jgi:hypothetical protein
LAGAAGNGVLRRGNGAAFARDACSHGKRSVARGLARAAVLLLIGAVLVAGLARRALAADEEVDLLLVLAADISRSVDDKKFRLQREGYAAALTDPRVVRAMTGGPLGRIALSFLEWSSDGDQIVLVDWTAVGSEAAARTIAERVRDAPRTFIGRTAIGAAIDFAVLQLGHSRFHATRRVIDVSGDGTNNSGRPVTLARDAAIALNITINGLVILSDVPLPTNPAHTHPPGGLTAYYESNVIGGPDAFVVEAQSFEAFGQSLISKLIKEIAAAQRRGHCRGERAASARALRQSQYELAEVGVLGKVADPAAHVCGVDADPLPALVGRLKGNFVQHALHYRLQSARADVLDRRIDLHGNVCERLDRVVGEAEDNPFRCQQRDVLLDEARLGLGQYAAQILPGQGFELDPDR